MNNKHITRRLTTRVKYTRPTSLTVGRLSKRYMNKMRLPILLFIFFYSAATSASNVVLETASVHLFLEKSGILSNNVNDIDPFYSFNFRPFGEGIPENELFHEILIKLKFSSKKETYTSENVASILVKNKLDKSILLKKEISSLYIGKEKVIYKGIWLPNVSCTPLTIEIKSSDNYLYYDLPFHCGE